MFPRLLSRVLGGGRKSVLLLGPRQVGKSTLVRGLRPDLAIDLADEEEFLAHAGDPGLLRHRLAAARPRTVLVDEIQRLPRLLHTIQSILDAPRPPRFFLTGSSARKLRRGRANLLPGRVHAFRLGPLTLAEVGDAFDERRALSTGMLPGIYAEADARERTKTLRSYASTYVREEVQAEALTRNVEGFARFLRHAAVASGHFTDHAALSRLASVPRTTVQRNFEILEDTLLATRLDAFAKSERRRLVQHPKHYFFDVGVYNALVGSFDTSADRIGVLFEHFLLSQIVSLAHALDADVRVSTFRTEHGAEVDFVLEHGREVWAVEAKSAARVGSGDTGGLGAFARFHDRPHRAIVAYRGEHRLALGKVEVLPYRELLAQLATELGG